MCLLYEQLCVYTCWIQSKNPMMVSAKFHNSATNSPALVVDTMLRQGDTKEPTFSIFTVFEKDQKTVC